MRSTEELQEIAQVEPKSEKWSQSMREQELSWEAFWEGFKLGRNVENYPPVTKRTARENFDNWWDQNR